MNSPLGHTQITHDFLCKFTLYYVISNLSYNETRINRITVMILLIYLNRISLMSTR